MSPAVHDKRTINDLKGKPETISKRTPGGRSRPRPTAPRPLPGKLPTASRVRTRTVCSDRARRTRSSTRRTARPSVPQPAWTRRRRRRHIGNVPSPGNVPATANVPGGAFTTHTASRSASALTMIRAGLDMWYECESEGGAATVAALEKMSALTAHDDKLGAAVSAGANSRSASSPRRRPLLDSQPPRRRQPFWCVEPHDRLSRRRRPSSGHGHRHRSSGPPAEHLAEPGRDLRQRYRRRRQRLRRRLQRLQPRRRYGQRFTGRPLARLALRGHHRRGHEQRHRGRGRRRRERLS